MFAIVPVNNSIRTVNTLDLNVSTPFSSAGKSFGTHDHQRSRICAALSVTMTVMSTGVV